MTAKKIALVTGGNRGIGHCIAASLAERDDVHVVLTTRSPEKSQAAVAALSQRDLHTSSRELDVTDPGAIGSVVQGVIDEFGRIDILVNNAGIAIDKFQPALDVAAETIRTTFETNVYGPLSLIQAVVPHMRRHGYGRIVNLSSELGSLGDAKLGSTLAYRMSKTALNAITVYIAAELKDDNILVNAAAPGWCATELGGEGAPRSAQQGADTAVWLATLPDDGPRGGFFRDREPYPW